MTDQAQSGARANVTAKGIAQNAFGNRRPPELRAADLIDYRLYFHDEKGHIRSAAELACPSDDHAANIAGLLLQGAPGELWERGRCVVRFEPDHK